MPSSIHRKLVWLLRVPLQLGPQTWNTAEPHTTDVADREFRCRLLQPNLFHGLSLFSLIHSLCDVTVTDSIPLHFGPHPWPTAEPHNNFLTCGLFFAYVASYTTSLCGNITPSRPHLLERKTRPKNREACSTLFSSGVWVL